MIHIKSRLVAAAAQAVFLCVQLLAPCSAIGQTVAETEAAAHCEGGATHAITEGTHILDASAAQSFCSLAVSQGATAVIDVAHSPTFTLPGNFNNAGTVYFASSLPDVATATLNAANIFNQAGGLISTALPAGGIAGFNSAVANLNFVLNAVNDIVNAGTIASAGNLTMTAGGSIINQGQAAITAAQNVALASAIGSITNSGIIAATAGNINIQSMIAQSTALQAAQNLAIDNVGGTIQALNGAINVRDALFSGSGNLAISGGDLLAKELNLFSGLGTIDLKVGRLDGALNITGAASHVTAATETLTIGTAKIDGDPTFINSTGGILINGLVTAAESLAILANGDITATGSTARIELNSSTATPFNLLMIAGAAISPNGNTDSSTLPGGTPTTSNVTVDFNAGNGGNIDLSGSTFAGPIINTSGASGGAGGNVVLAARANGTTGGRIVLPAMAVNTSGDGGGANGNVTMIAGAPGGTSISTGSITTNGGIGGGGSVSITTAAPTGSLGSTIVVRPDGIIDGGAAVVPGTLILPGDVSINNLVTNGASVSILAGGNITSNGQAIDASQTFSGSGGSIDISSAGGAVTLGPVTSTGSGGADGDITLSAGTSLEAGDITGGNVTLTFANFMYSNTLNASGNVEARVLAGGTLANNGAITAADAGRNISVTGLGNLAISGTGTYTTSSSGTTSFLAMSPGSTLTIGAGSSVNIDGGGAIRLRTPNLRFVVDPGPPSSINATGASAISIDSGNAATDVDLTITVAGPGVATISTGSGGSLTIGPTGQGDLRFSGVGNTGIDLNGAQVNVTGLGDVTIDSGFVIRSDSAIFFFLNNVLTNQLFTLDGFLETTASNPGSPTIAIQALFGGFSLAGTGGITQAGANPGDTLFNDFTEIVFTDGTALNIASVNPGSNTFFYTQNLRVGSQSAGAASASIQVANNDNVFLGSWLPCPPCDISFSPALNASSATLTINGAPISTVTSAPGGPVGNLAFAANFNFVSDNSITLNSDSGTVTINGSISSLGPTSAVTIQSSDTLVLGGTGTIATTSGGEVNINAPTNLDLLPFVNLTISSGEVEIDTAQVRGPNFASATFTLSSPCGCINIQEENGDTITFRSLDGASPTFLNFNASSVSVNTANSGAEVIVSPGVLLSSNGVWELNFFDDATLRLNGTISSSFAGQDVSIAILAFGSTVSIAGTGRLDPGAGNSVGILAIDTLALTSGLNLTVASGDLEVSTSNFVGADNGTATISALMGPITIADGCACLVISTTTPGSLTTFNLNAPGVTINADSLTISAGVTIAVTNTGSADARLAIISESGNDLSVSSTLGTGVFRTSAGIQISAATGQQLDFTGGMQLLSGPAILSASGGSVVVDSTAAVNYTGSLTVNSPLLTVLGTLAPLPPNTSLPVQNPAGTAPDPAGAGLIIMSNTIDNMGTIQVTAAPPPPPPPFPPGQPSTNTGGLNPFLLTVPDGSTGLNEQIGTRIATDYTSIYPPGEQNEQGAAAGTTPAPGTAGDTIDADFFGGGSFTPVHTTSQQPENGDASPSLHKVSAGRSPILVAVAPHMVSDVVPAIAGSESCCKQQLGPVESGPGNQGNTAQSFARLAQGNADATIAGRSSPAHIAQRPFSNIEIGEGMTEKHLPLSKGNVVLAPTQPVVVSTPEAVVHIQRGSVVMVMKRDNATAVYNLDDRGTGAVKVVADKRLVELPPGVAIILTRDKSADFAAVNPAPGIGYRSVQSQDLGESIKAFQASFSLASALSTVKPLHHSLVSSDKAERKLARRLLKNAVTLTQLTAAAGPYKTARQ